MNARCVTPLGSLALVSLLALAGCSDQDKTNVIADGSSQDTGNNSDLSSKQDSAGHPDASADSHFSSDLSSKQDSAGHPDASADSDFSGTMISGAWVSIPAGSFSMGSPASEPCRWGLDEQQHQVTLTRAFDLQATEVTQGQFETLMGYNPAYFGPNGNGASCGSDCPVEEVNWHEAVAYCNTLSAAHGYNPCYSCSGSGPDVTCQEASAYSGQNIYTCPGYRLPTDAEWEWAYRAGSSTAYYNGANDVNACNCEGDANAKAIDWYCANSNHTPHPIGQKQANAWGLYDMAGNVWEWCHDWQSQLGSAATDPWGSSSGSSRVVRGGSWYGFASGMRAAYRGHYLPASRYTDAGFRCARTKQP